MGRSSSWSTVGMESLLDEDALTMASSIEDLVNKLPAYDYIRCTFTDMNGVARGRVLPTSTTAEFLTKGMGLYAGALYWSPDGELPLKSMPISITDQGHPSATWLPDPASLHFLTWAGGDSRRVAQAFGVFHMPIDGVLQPMSCDTRALAQKQLKRLDDHDWSLKAGAEMEFRLLGADDLPHVDAPDYAGQLSFAGLDDVLFYLSENLLEAGVHTETMHTEYAAGQLVQIVIHSTM